MGSAETPFKPLADTALFRPLQLGRLLLAHRVAMAPMTRMRGTKLSDGIWVPNDLTAKYYAQRSTRGGLLISEGLPICRSVRLRLFTSTVLFNHLTNVITSRPPATPASPVFSPPPKSTVGTTSPPPSTTMAATSTPNFGTLAEPLGLLSAGPTLSGPPLNV